MTRSSSYEIPRHPTLSPNTITSVMGVQGSSGGIWECLCWYHIFFCFSHRHFNFVYEYYHVCFFVLYPYLHQSPYIIVPPPPFSVLTYFICARFLYSSVYPVFSKIVFFISRWYVTLPLIRFMMIWKSLCSLWFIKGGVNCELKFFRTGYVSSSFLSSDFPPGYGTLSRPLAPPP